MGPSLSLDTQIDNSENDVLNYSASAIRPNAFWDLGDLGPHLSWGKITANKETALLLMGNMLFYVLVK